MFFKFPAVRVGKSIIMNQHKYKGSLNFLAAFGGVEKAPTC